MSDAQPLKGVLAYRGDGISLSAQAMVSQMYQMEIHSNNIGNFGVPGYQKETPMVTTFAEVLGMDGVGVVKSQEIGRLRASGKPLDCALATPGYFQKLAPSGQIERTRDGRFKLDVEGNLLALDNKPVLSIFNQPIRLNPIPADINQQVKITEDGEIVLLNPRNLTRQFVARLAVVDEVGNPQQKVDVKQGYVEDSNVYLQQEFADMMPIRRNFEANRQMFINQNDGLSRMIQELGRAQ